MNPTTYELSDTSLIFGKALEIIKGYYDHSAEMPVIPYMTPADVRKQIDLTIATEGTDVTTLFQQLDTIMRLSPKTSSKGFFNLLIGGKIMPVVAADMIASALNNTMHTYKSAGVHILIEQETIKYFLSKVGFDHGDGIFVPGGSLGNLAALIIARGERYASIKQEGMYSLPRLTTYVSDQGQYSIAKGINFIGVGLDNMRTIPSDARGHMDVEALEAAIQADISAGYAPFFINATAGTTVLGCFDPLDEIAAVAKKYALWLHVDAALGGTFAIHPTYRQALLKGIEQADSVSRSAHKMMNVPLYGSMILVKEKGMLEKHFDEHADYLVQMDADSYDLNPASKSLQCGRRNNALKVWAALKLFGEEGYIARINQQMTNAQHAVQRIKADPALHLIIEPEGINVCFQVVGVDSLALCNYLDMQGLLKVSAGNRAGQSFIRMICVDADMTTDDIDAFFDLLIDAAKSYTASPRA